MVFSLFFYRIKAIGKKDYYITYQNLFARFEVYKK